MKKLLKFFAVPAILALGLLAGCVNDLDSIDLNVTVSTDTPQLDNPKNLGYGVLLTWRQVKDNGRFKVTRQAKGGEEKVIADDLESNRYFDAVDFGNVLETGVEYTYRVYNLSDKQNHYDYQMVVKDSYAEKKITLAEGSVKAQGEKLPALTADDVMYTFAEVYDDRTSRDRGTFKFSIKDEEKAAYGWTWVEITNSETGAKCVDRKDDGSKTYIINDNINKIDVQIFFGLNDYYGESEALRLDGIPLKRKAAVDISDFNADKKNGTVELTWTTDVGVEASAFVIEKKEASESAYKVLAVTPTSEANVGGKKCTWTAVDTDIAVSKEYVYRIRTTRLNSYKTASTMPSVSLDSFAATVYNKIDGNKNGISKADDYVVLSFEGISDYKAVTYNAWWTTFDNKRIESAKTAIAFTKDGDTHFRAQFASEALGVKANTTVKSVKFYVEAFVDGKLVAARSRSIDVDVYLTSYTAFSFVGAPLVDNTERKITLKAEGQKFTETDKVEITYFKDASGKVETATLTWVAVADEPNTYSAEFTVAENGNYTICAKLPMGNMYDYDDDESVFAKNMTCYVYKSE